MIKINKFLCLFGLFICFAVRLILAINVVDFDIVKASNVDSWLVYSRRKSPWSRRKRKWALTPHQWRSLFTPEGKLRDGGVGFLKKVRSRVSLLNKDHMYVLFLTCLFTGSDLCSYGSVGCWSKYSCRSVAVLTRSV